MFVKLYNNGHMRSLRVFELLLFKTCTGKYTTPLLDRSEIMRWWYYKLDVSEKCSWQKMKQLEQNSGSSGTSFLCGNENRVAKRDVIDDQTKMTPMNSMTTRMCGSQLYIEKGAVKISI